MFSKLELPVCPYCGVNKPNLGQTYVTQTSDHSGKVQRDWGFFVCASCGGIVTVAASKGTIAATLVLPEPASVDKDIPEIAGQYLQQAIDSRHTPAGAVLLAACSVDAMLKVKGLREGSLFSRIDKAANDHVITADMAAWAHKIRLDANEQRHVDEAAALPNEADAAQCIEFAVALGTFMFVLPEKIKRGLRKASE